MGVQTIEVQPKRVQYKNMVLYNKAMDETGDRQCPISRECDEDTS